MKTAASMQSHSLALWTRCKFTIQDCLFQAARALRRCASLCKIFQLKALHLGGVEVYPARKQLLLDDRLHELQIAQLTPNTEEMGVEKHIIMPSIWMLLSRGIYIL
jgi:hypothetical protein